VLAVVRPREQRDLFLSLQPCLEGAKSIVRKPTAYAQDSEQARQRNPFQRQGRMKASRMLTFREGNAIASDRIPAFRRPPKRRFTVLNSRPATAMTAQHCSHRR
jgi:hypothetical protein